MAKKAIKYAILTVCGVILFTVLNRAANTERTAASIGGEVFLLILPLMWWIVERTIKDFVGECKRAWREIKSDSGETPQEHKQATMEVTKDD